MDPSPSPPPTLSPIEDAMSSARQAEDATRLGNYTEARQLHKRAKDKFETVARDMRELGDVDTAVGLDLLVAFHRARATELRSKTLQPTSVTPITPSPRRASSSTTTTNKPTQQQPPTTQSVVASVSQAWGQMMEMGQSLLLEQQQSKTTTSATTITAGTTNKTVKSTPSSQPPPPSQTSGMTMRSPSPPTTARGVDSSQYNSRFMGDMGESYFLVPPGTSTGAHGGEKNTGINATTTTTHVGGGPNTTRGDETPTETEARLQSDIRVLTAVLKKMEKENAKLKRELKKEQEAARNQSRRFWQMFLSLKKTMDELGGAHTGSTTTASGGGR